MRKLLLANIAVAALATGALMPGNADATTLGTAAGLRPAVDGAAPLEQVHYYGRRYHRRHVGIGIYPYGLRAYAYDPYPRRHRHIHRHHHHHW